ncbi:DUF1329 domain-containing protein [Pseudomonas sp. PCH199]|uniref:DUF1329 domain-containing protein n=1 Tax=unclassified Pseudomonas TaxID=196821 RepID=UPI000BC50226|nr:MULTISPECIES: DUF1329 domain-containing protein [unclassified Pseudomonas]MCW8279095.1 DUF1329 domain-containing protein [Pseudomonas sp. PCH199]PAM79608.1 outer membrane lipoprotein-sorting protein [Pseudomonas sp. ERMR1:02]
MKKSSILTAGVLALTLLASSVMAAVSQQEADKLGTVLTPFGGQKEGNADGSIPAWTGGLKTNAAPVTNDFIGNPFEGEKPQFVITAANAAQYKDKLTPGQMAMFQRYSQTYKIPVYKSQRTASSTQGVYEAVKTSALNTVPVNDGYGLQNFEKSHYYAFPIPKSGLEVVWNHLTRYRGTSFIQNLIQATPQVNGSYTLVNVQQSAGFPWQMKDADPQQSANILFYVKQEVTAPARMAGNVLLVHETLDQLKEPRMAWAYSAGQRRVRRAPQVAYDGPGTAADGLRVADQNDMFNGAPDRYDWKLIGKKEMYVPYNNYSLFSPKVKYDEIIKAGHINQDLTRYELHRVWEVEGTLKAGERHIYAKRHMYFDEDTWAIVEVDHYDGRGQLWRVGEGFLVNDYVQGTANYAAVTVYDLIAGRYIVSNLQNENKRGQDYSYRPTMTDFTPAALRNAGIR